MNPEIWRNVFDAIEDPAFLHDAQFCVLRANRAYWRAAGVTEAQALGKPYWEVFPPGTGPLPGCKEAMLGKGDASSSEEVSVGAKLFLSKGYPIRDDQGKYLYSLHLLSDISAQRQATAALAESEERFRRATETARDAIIILDGVSGAVTAWNPAAEVMFGYGKEEVIGRVLNDFLPPLRFREAMTKGMAHFATTGEGATIDQTLELAALHKNGTEFPIELSLSAAQIHGKWHATGIARDISERKRAQEALARKERYYRKMIEGGSDVFFLIDRAGTLLYRSESGKQLTGWETADVLGKPVTDFVPAESLPLVRSAMAEIFTKPAQLTRVEVRMLRKDGTQVETEVLARNLLDDPDVAGIVITARAITERKKSEEGLKLFRALVDQSTDAIEVLDPETLRFLDVNQTACLDLGYSREELLSLNIFDIDPALDRSRSTEMIQQVRKLGSLIIEGRHRRKDGSEFPVEISIGYVQLDRAYMIAITRDITKRKQDERALARANRALRTLSACNEVLVRSGNESELLDSICRLIVETGGYRMAWVGFPEQDPVKTVCPVAQYGHDEEYQEAVNISWADSQRGHGPTGTAMRTGTVQVNQNFLTNPALTLWREVALPRGYHASIALPLKSSTGTLGVLTIYASEPDAFNEAEVRLLQELAGDLAFGIETLRIRVERDRIAHEQLHHTEILRQSLEDSIKAIAATVEMRDAYTAGHQRRVGLLAVAIARELGLPEGTSRGIELAASIHDLGKISVPAEILSKPGKLTAIELMLVKTHAQAGFDILKDIKFPWPIATMVLQHHERLDGSGYPQGLKGEQILLESRIMAVADVVEAMASHRPYRAALGIDSALQEIERGRGSVYDAAVVDACIRLFAEKRFVFST